MAQIDEILGGLSSLFLLQEHYGSPMSDLCQTSDSFAKNSFRVDNFREAEAVF